MPQKLSAEDSLWRADPVFKVSGFMDIYYAYDFNKPQSELRQPFFYNYDRHNEVSINIGVLKFAVEHSKYRANLSFQTGSYVDENYPKALGALRYVNEANAGLSLTRKNNLWLDVGIFPGHIGFESIVTLDNWTLTRSLIADNTPYYQAGGKLTFSPTKKWDLSLFLLNGWQRIERVQGNSLPSFGAQVAFRPTEKTTLNYSSFVGSDFSDAERRMRYYHNVYGIFQLTKKFGLIADFDWAMQQQVVGSQVYDFLFAPLLIARYQHNAHWATAFRAEYYYDSKNILVAPINRYGFVTSGLSLNVDYRPIPNIVCRMEGRCLASADPIFEHADTWSKSNWCFVASVAMQFGKSFR